MSASLLRHSVCSLSGESSEESGCGEKTYDMRAGRGDSGLADDQSDPLKIASLVHLVEKAYGARDSLCGP